MSGAVASATNAETIRTDFLTLLVNQLRYQNPLEPMSNNEMASQLAQISQLENMESIRSFSEQLLLAQQRGEAAALIGKTVAFVQPDEDKASSGVVQSVEISGGKVRLNVGDRSLELDEILAITDQAQAPSERDLP